MAKLSFFKGKRTNLSSAPINEGALFVTTDTNELFADYKDDNGVIARHQIVNSNSITLENGATIELNDEIKNTYSSAGNKYVISFTTD
jgi:uncharacterized beta-barrel protein YwiB (DUF1934 family)